MASQSARSCSRSDEWWLHANPSSPTANVPVWLYVYDVARLAHRHKAAGSVIQFVLALAEMAKHPRPAASEVLTCKFVCIVGHLRSVTRLGVKCTSLYGYLGQTQKQSVPPCMERQTRRQSFALAAACAARTASSLL